MLRPWGGGGEINFSSIGTNLKIIYSSLSKVIVFKDYLLKII
jgi:hypothetical protein